MSEKLIRITSILVELLSKRLVNATKLSEKFDVSVRTIYRDLKTLESAGIPLLTQEGKGYSVMEGYKIPPVMFTEDEANALLTAELIIKASKDVSLIHTFASATAKVRAVMPYSTRNRTELLEKKMGISNTYIGHIKKSRYLLDLQKAMLDFSVLKMSYTDAKQVSTNRLIEPFAVFANQNDEWVMVAYCRLRNDFRTFSLTGINELLVTGERFDPHNITLEQYLKQKYKA